MSLREVWLRLEREVEQGRPDRAFDLASRLLDRTPEEQHAAHRVLRTLMPRLSACALNPTRRAVMRRLGLLPPTPRPRIGQVDFPTVLPDESRFVAVRVGLTTGASRILPAGLPIATQLAVADALTAVRQLSGVAQEFEVVFEVAITGQSCGLAVALAALSRQQSQPIADRLIASGRVLPDGRVDSVSKIPEKLLLRAEARPGSTLLVPADVVPPHEQIIPVRSLAHALEILGHRTGHDVDEELQLVRRQFRSGAWLDAAARAELLIEAPELEDADRVELLTVLLCAANHTGRSERAAALVARLELMLDGELLPAVAAQARASCLVAAVDCFRADLARAVLDTIATRTWQREEQVHLRGAQALLAVYEDRLADAVALRQRNCQDASIDEQPRCLGDLADSLWRSGAVHEARVVIEQALAALQRTQRRHGYQRQTQPFLHLHAARIYRACQLPDLALKYLDRALETAGPDPRLRLRLEHAILTGGPPALATLWAEHPFLHDSAVFQALYLCARVQAGDVDAAPELAGVMKITPVPTAAELCRRFPY